MHLCQLSSTLYTAKQIKNCMKSTSVTKVANMKNTNGAVPLNYHLNSELSIMLHCLLYSTRYTAVQIRNHSVIKVATMKNTDDFCYKKETITWHHQIDTFCCQQRWMEHKWGHWLVHEECIVHTAVCQRHHSDWSDVKQYKNQACSISLYWVMLVWRHQKIRLNFFNKCSYFLKTFWVNLKACLGFNFTLPILPNLRVGKLRLVLGDIIFSSTPTPLLSLLWTAIVVHDTVVGELKPRSLCFINVQTEIDYGNKLILTCGVFNIRTNS